MKTYKHLWEQLITEENFKLALKLSQKKKRRKRQVRRFNRKAEENLEKVRQLVISGEFHTAKYKEQKIYEPKERMIYKLPYDPDRIVQHAIMNILEPIFVNLLIENTYACVKGRGPLKASLKTSEYVRKYKYCLKCDIRKFYPSIDQKILSEKLHRIIKDERFMALLDDVIFSYPGGKNCPIGNYLSQWFGNYYLSFLDNYVLHELKPKAYIRYCDDFTLYSNSKQELHVDREKIRIFLKGQLKLEFSKAEVFSVKQGVDFCGYRHFGKYVLIRKSTGITLKRRYRNIGKKLESGDFNLQKIRGQVASGKGLTKHACTHNLCKSIRQDELWNRILEETEKERKEKNENTDSEGRNQHAGPGREQRLPDPDRN